MQAYKSSTWRRVTLSDRIPPPTGVVSGPLMATRCARIASRVASGSQLPTCLKAFSPASTSSHAPLAAADLVDRRVEHPARRAPDIGSRPIAFYKRDDRAVGHHPLAVPVLEALAHRTPLLRGISGFRQR